jgi:cephalosporin-C deacetylase-like acetyl esterase
LFSSNVFFFYQIYSIPFENWERILTLMIRRAKGLELMNYFFITHLNTFDSKVFLTLKIMDFENVALTKVVHIYVIKDMNS